MIHYTVAVIVFSVSVVHGIDQSWIAAACARSNNQLSFCAKTNTGPQLRDAESVDVETPATPNPITVVTQTPSSDPFRHLLPADSVNTQTPGPFADTTLPPAVHRTELCAKYEDRYYYYCLNITKQPASLQPTLREMCPKYEAGCASEITTKPPGDLLPTVVYTTTTLQPCTYQCKAEHCTRACKCAYYKDEMKRECLPDNMFPMWQQNCQVWYKSCKDLYKIPDVYLHPSHRTGDGTAPVGTPAVNGTGGGGTGNVPGSTVPGTSNMGGQPGAYGNLGQERKTNDPVGFWDSGTDQNTDWANGDVAQGKNFNVPAVGIGGQVNHSDIKFPGPLGFLGRRKRAAKKR